MRRSRSDPLETTADRAAFRARFARSGRISALTATRACDTRRDGARDLEVGYHLLPEHQGKGLATEAATACRDHARAPGIERLIAIMVPENVPSQRVAQRIGLALDRATVTSTGLPIHVYAADL